MRDPFALCGTTIDGRFRVDDVIGEGGFGVVYLGVHLKLDHPVAIKCLKIPEHFTPDAKKLFLERFREEARTLLKLGDAPGVPRLFDYDVHRVGGRDIPLFVMEWLQGKTLEEALAARKRARLGPLAATDALAIMIPAVEALANAHHHKIAHRDIKPANLFIAKGGRGLCVKVLDFGIAKGMQEGETLAQSQSKTATNFRAFTPNYAAPEQFQPKQYGASGPWSDVHSLGLILVELLTGTYANSGVDLVECLENVTNPVRPSPRARGAKVSDQLEAVALRTLALQPAQRFADAGALALALSAVPEAKNLSPKAALETLFGAEPAEKPKTPHGPTGTQLVPSDPTVVAPTGATKEPVSKTAAEAAERKRGAFLVAAAAVVGGGALLFALTRGEPKKPPKRPPPDEPSTEVATPGPSARTKDTPTGKNEVSLARGVATVREIVPILPIAESDAKGQRHVRITRVDGRVVTVEFVGPAGSTYRTDTITYGADGGWESVQKNSRGQVSETVKRTKDGLETHVARSGSPFVDGCARWSYKFTDRGDSLDRGCQDAQGHVIIDGNGCQIVRMDLNDKSLVTTRRCYQADGVTPLADSDGIHLKRMSYDERGNLIEEVYFDAEGRSTKTQGCASRRREYDAAGNWTLHTCIGATGLPAQWGGGAIVSNRFAYDDNGCQTKEENLDIDGRPTNYGRLAAQITKRDAHCTVVAQETRDASGKLVANGFGWARSESTLDAEGNEIEKRCSSADGGPASCIAPFYGADGHVVLYKYDDRGRQISKRYVDEKGNPTSLKNMYPHETRSLWDDQGLLREKTYWDADGKPAPALVDVGKRVFRYDALGSMTGFECWGIDGKPIVSKGVGLHEVRQTYDDKHRFVTIELLDLDKKPAAKPTIQLSLVVWPTGAVRMDVARDGSRIVQNRFFDAGGKLLQELDCRDETKPCHRVPVDPN